MPFSKAEIRKQIRARRRSLTAKELADAEHNLCQSARGCAAVWRAEKLLYYRSFEGEISPQKLVNKLPAKQTLLPRITHYGHCTMQFYSDQYLDSHNRYGILEPSAIGEPAKANSFDVILVPLVAFDRSGSRIGMGAGFYDRALESLSHQASTRPFLLGVAHAFQEVNELPSEPWDIPLDAILTDSEYILVKH